jgi:hypothetical protein
MRPAAKRWPQPKPSVNRRAEKRARGATASAIGQMQAREVLDRGFYLTAGGVFSAKVPPRLYVDIVLPEAGTQA